MIQLLLVLAVGVLIGWNWAQPLWARRIQARLVNLINPPPDKRD